MAEKEDKREPLAARLLPLLTERMGRLRFNIEALRETARLGAGTAFEGLEGLGEQIDQLGWALGVTCAHGGADVLMERNREDGATLLLNFVRELRGRAPLDEPLPRLTPACPPLFPYLLAQLAWWGSPEASAPSFELLGEVWSICGDWPGGGEKLLPVCELQDSHLSLHGNATWHLEVPRGWVHP